MLYVILFLAVLGAFFYFMFREAPPPQFFGESDKLLHFFAFAAIVVLGDRILGACTKCRWVFVALVMLLALGSEFVHGSSLLPQRSFDPLDLAMNVAGCLIGMAVLFGVNYRQLRKASVVGDVQKPE